MGKTKSGHLPSSLDPTRRPGSMSCGSPTIHYVLAVAFVVTSLFMLVIRVRGPARAGGAQDFVAVNGSKLELHCRPFYISGFNTHDLVQNAMLTPAEYHTYHGLSGDQMVKQVMEGASKAGLNVARTWAHTNHARFEFQISPGKYSEKGWHALDLVIEAARRNGMRLILSIVDNWKYYNGVDQYVDWSSTVPERTRERPVDESGDPTPLMYQNDDVKHYEVQRHSLFYTDPKAKQLYKDHVDALLSRVNSYSGRRYSRDPTIMAWNLINEPRCETWLLPGCDQQLQAWLAEMAAYVHERAPLQLIMIGSEGFYSADSPQVCSQADFNPQPWATQMGQNFTANTLTAGVDVAGIHVWPNNWERTSDDFLLQWVESHVEASQALGKPLVLEEFGKKLLPTELRPSKVRELRDHVYRITYSAVEKHINNGAALVGSLYWRWNLPMFDGEGPGDYGVDPSDTTFGIIREHAKFIQNKIHSKPSRPNCGYECWVPVQKFGFNTCQNVPSACREYWQAHAAGSRLPSGPFFISKPQCCKARYGAYENGCSWWPF